MSLKKKDNSWFKSLEKYQFNNEYFVIFSLCIAAVNFGWLNIDILLAYAVPDFKCTPVLNENFSNTVNHNSTFDGRCYVNVKIKDLYVIERCQNWTFGSEFGKTISTDKINAITLSMCFIKKKMGCNREFAFKNTWKARFGRKYTSLLSYLFCYISRCLIVFSPNIYVYSLFRLLSSLFDMSSFIIFWILGLENFSEHKRFNVNILVVFSWSIGLTSIAGIYYFIKNWKHATLIISNTTILSCICILCLMKESESWQKLSEIKENLNFDKDATDQSELKIRSGIINIFNDKPMRKKALALYIMGFTTSTICYGMNFSSQYFYQNVYVTVSAFNCTYLFSTIAIYFMYNFNVKVKKKYIITFNLISATVSFVVLSFLEANSVAILLVGVYGLLTLGMNFSLGYILTPFQFPVSLRGKGTSLFVFSTRLGLVFGSGIVYWQKSNPVIIAVIYSILGLITTILLMLYVPTKSSFKDKDILVENLK
ncbi:hypothetical protein A3Q56_00306 [Intoshia linei]|uniref:Major facilitator superfamily (MFS) profile domain-containing protein n=1 Tax=Intoshia linei TaxID=1819745 RepID=A0A177BC65_9BILA|nr:hypothetical protein A3Q56_00306 [Intoshia linei]